MPQILLPLRKHLKMHTKPLRKCLKWCRRHLEIIANHCKNALSGTPVLFFFGCVLLDMIFTQRGKGIMTLIKESPPSQGKLPTSDRLVACYCDTDCQGPRLISNQTKQQVPTSVTRTDKLTPLKHVETTSKPMKSEQRIATETTLRKGFPPIFFRELGAKKHPKLALPGVSGIAIFPTPRTSGMG